MSSRHYGAQKGRRDGATLARLHEGEALRASPIACAVADAWVETLDSEYCNAVLEPFRSKLDDLEKATRGSRFRHIGIGEESDV